MHMEERKSHKNVAKKSFNTPSLPSTTTPLKREVEQAIICSFITAFGTVMICMTTRTVDDDGEFKGKTKTVILSIGIALTAIGGLGYIFTIYEVIKRGHEKLTKGHKRKLEEQVERKRKETIAKEARKQTIQIMDESPSVEGLQYERVQWM